MLRRYLIANVVSSALLYAAALTYVPSFAAMTRSINTSFEVFVMGHTFLAPVLHRIVMVGAN